MNLFKRIFLLCLLTYLPLNASADCLSDGGDPATCQLIDSINRLNTQLQGFEGAFTSIEDLASALGGLDFGNIFSELKDNINDKIENINLGPLEPLRNEIGFLPTIGVGILAVPAAVKLSRVAIRLTVKGLVATTQQLHELITRKKRDEQWLKDFHQAKRNWDNMYALSKKLEMQIINLTTSMNFSLLLNKSNDYIQKYGAEMAINGMFAELKARKSLINEDLKVALRENNVEKAKELKHEAAVVEKNFSSAKQIKTVLAGGMGDVSESLDESYRQLQQVEGDLQKARAHILGSVDLWQNEWKKEYKVITTKFRRARRKTDNFYRKAVRIARADKGKNKLRLRLLLISNKIDKVKHKFEVERIEETFEKQLNLAKEDRKSRIKQAKLLFVNFSAKYGEHQSYMKWFDQLTMQQINLSESIKRLSDIYSNRVAGESSLEESKDSSNDAPTEDAPAEDAPAEDAPAEDAPAEDAPAEDSPSEEGSGEETKISA